VRVKSNSAAYGIKLVESICVMCEEKTSMAVVTILELPGLTQDGYEQVGAALGLTEAPAGILHHSCGAIDSGWRVVDIWESQAAWDAFLDGVYLPAVRSLGGAEPSRRESMETHHAGAVGR
jgi:hypothetical protein